LRCFSVEVGQFRVSTRKKSKKRNGSVRGVVSQNSTAVVFARNVSSEIEKLEKMLRSEKLGDLQMDIGEFTILTERFNSYIDIQLVNISDGSSVKMRLLDTETETKIITISLTSPLKV